jgi:hypothetical protein
MGPLNWVREMRAEKGPTRAFTPVSPTPAGLWGTQWVHKQAGGIDVEMEYPVKNGNRLQFWWAHKDSNLDPLIKSKF